MDASLFDIVNQPNHYYRKLVVAGDMHELYQYDLPIRQGKGKKQDKWGDDEGGERGMAESNSNMKRVPDTTPKEKRADNLLRAKREARWLVWSNMRVGAPQSSKCDLWLTFTYADEQRAQLNRRAECMADIERFITRYRKLYPDAGYIYVAEIQDGKRNEMRGVDKPARNTIHWHMLLFGAPKLNDYHIRPLWGLGRTWTKRVEGSREEVRRYANYIAKYIAKSPLADFNEKTFIPSLNLKQPQVFKRPSHINRALQRTLGWKRYRGDPWKMTNRDGTHFNTVTRITIQHPDLSPPRWWLNAKAARMGGAAVPLHHESCDT